MSEPSLDGALLSTIDNPYNPHTHFREWYTYDVQRGHNTSALLARITTTSHELPLSLYESDIDYAMREIVKQNVSGVHILVYKDSA